MRKYSIIHFLLIFYENKISLIEINSKKNGITSFLITFENKILFMI
jgi:hypothetical protein